MGQHMTPQIVDYSLELLRNLGARARRVHELLPLQPLDTFGGLRTNFSSINPSDRASVIFATLKITNLSQKPEKQHNGSSARLGVRERVEHRVGVRVLVCARARVQLRVRIRVSVQVRLRVHAGRVRPQIQLIGSLLDRFWGLEALTKIELRVMK